MQRYEKERIVKLLNINYILALWNVRNFKSNKNKYKKRPQKMRALLI